MKILIIRGSGITGVKELVDLANADKCERVEAEQKLDEEIRQILHRVFEDGEPGEDENEVLDLQEGADRSRRTLH